MIRCQIILLRFYTKWKTKSSVNIVTVKSIDFVILDYSRLVWSLCGFIISINTRTRFTNLLYYSY